VHDKSDHLDLSMDIIFTSEKRPGSSGVVHIGTMEVEPGGQSIQVAVKLAFSEFEKATLEHEHKIYTHLHSRGVRGIPQDFGLFVDDELVDDVEGPYALIMTFAGDSLFRRESNVDSSVKSAILATFLHVYADLVSRMNMLSTWRAIHKAGVIHGDVRLPNLCATDSGEAFIIDFSHAAMSTSRNAKASEITQICRLLSIDEGGARAQPALKKELKVADLRRSTRIKQMRERPEAVGLAVSLNNVPI
jgi:predicted Ser/Thr protein kinase